MQPVTPSTTSGRAAAASMLVRANTRSSAFSRTAQVLIRMRSARVGASRAPYPPRCRSPSTISLSATFIWQPYVST